MDAIRHFIDFFIHLDVHLGEIISRFGAGAYAILFLIVFCETGLVILPLLPGDSLLFAAGAFAALGSFELPALMLLLMLAAILGDTVNYWIGARIGPRAFSGDIRFLKASYLQRTTEFYQRHGGKTIVLARFVPIVRTFAPFVAGVGRMHYPRFLLYNVVGGVAWVTLFTLAGYFFGNIPAVKENFSLVILAIILLSVVPIAFEWLKARRRAPA
ncbi:MAG TPA: DedA family protein [Gemmatimonadales bacterium]|nr:DedA family protein [Gemmatimonadales bacterium]